MKAIDIKYANLLINTGINIQKGQTLLIHAEPVHYEFVTLLSETAYKRGAKRVIVKYASEHLQRLDYIYQDLDTLTQMNQWEIDEFDSYLSEDLVRLALRAPNPGLMNDVDSSKVLEHSKVRGKVMERYTQYSMSSQGQWLVCAYPTMSWAKAVFPTLNEHDAYDKLYASILYACRVSEDNDPQHEWELHNAQLLHQGDCLNTYNFKSLHFTNAKGTDITVGLVKGHIWGGGRKPSAKGIPFNANIPTEESFTTPDRMNVNGIVYNTLPLNNNGRLIDDFWLKFEDGKVTDFDAKVGKEALQALLKTDDNSNRLGEIALVSYDSPISKMNILFYNTLFDENASCHMALGRGYPLIENGSALSKEALEDCGINQSLIHVDFMFGSDDMKVVGKTFEGEDITIMEKGNITL
ncbi:peptidase M29 [Erysipelothrix larvae]|uniref:Peptidase M29 n=1 Tax=Erysipelothrix larvae TaxID=1514105 RepID=A0A0X8GZQ3_9FIRM|nr:aminopeptidase [Erysipelothrix larvae]AMC93414.1 peptidase M29 [Erysipelothrix larvae]